MKIQTLNINGEWENIYYRTEEELKKNYSDCKFIGEDEQFDGFKILIFEKRLNFIIYRILKPKICECCGQEIKG